MHFPFATKCKEAFALAPCSLSLTQLHPFCIDSVIICSHSLSAQLGELVYGTGGENHDFQAKLVQLVVQKWPTAVSVLDGFPLKYYQNSGNDLLKQLGPSCFDDDLFVV